MFYPVKYKEVDPKTTVASIKTKLWDLGIQTSEKMYSHGEITYSCRISISNPDVVNLEIGTNGKGATPDYALASGYAEFMERLQNKFLINEAMRFADRVNKEISSQFLFYPDERLVERPISEFRSLLKRIFPNGDCDRSDYEKFLKDISSIKYKELDYISFTDNGNTLGCPAILMRANSSTGMCAGNSAEEAILQGICEVFERYVLQQIYLNPITPPSFPMNYFCDTRISHLLSLLEGEGYLYDIKDMSLGLSLPVIGLILTEKSSGRTMFRLGSDPDVEIALERCMTEIFQGDQDVVRRAFIDYSQGLSLSDPERQGKYFRIQYLHSLRNGMGRYPEYLLGNEPTYPFTSWSWERTDSISETFRNTVTVIKNAGMELFVRDNSILGFCTYHVFIPGLSDIDFRLMPIIDDYKQILYSDSQNHMEENHQEVWPLYNIKGQKNFSKIIELINLKYSDSDELKLAPYNISSANKVNKHLLLFLLAIKDRNYMLAKQYYDRFMNDRHGKELPDNAYLECIMDYLDCIISGIDNIYGVLSKKFLSSVVDEVIADFSNTDNVMNNFRFPTCFSCNLCPIVEDCRFKNVIEIESRVKKHQIKNPVSQLYLSELARNLYQQNN